MDLSEMVRNAQGLISLPEVYYRAQELLDDPSSDSGSLAKVIETDTGLTARLLRIANSPLYRPAGRIDRISYAVTLLGSKALRDLVLSTVLLRAFEKISTDLVDLSAFWHHSLYCSLAARKLAKLHHVLHDERMLVAGIVHDVGQLLFYQMQPERAKKALLIAQPNDEGMYLAEIEVFGFSHAELGAELLRSWRLPEGLQAMVAFHHQPGGAGVYSLDASLLHLGNFIANRLEPGRQLAECAPKSDPLAWEITGLTEAVVEPVLSEVNDQFLEALDLLMPGRRAVN
jgi:putative nucleotidyltransferase with HDIG domain